MSKLNHNYSINFRDGIMGESQNRIMNDNLYRPIDNYYSIITQDFPPYEFIDA